ncbi:MAG: type II secretion system F family protein [Candidatus Omnitrophica bacterium]|nr:type II secretion system F family protein [Candidatus Omnitrophota bacterium]MDD5488378.1 type II secretion system F family protein [Candidatus Omnitrophota bacterium]
MSKFKYIAKDKVGQTLKGEVDASDNKQALNLLRGEGLMILRLEQVSEKGSFLSSLSFLSKQGAKVKTEEIVLFTRQIATMMSAGLTVVTSLDTLAEQVESLSFKKILLDIREAVNTGASLSDAMAKYEPVFTTFFVNMVRAGESSGMLDEVLDRVALYLEKTSALQKKIQSALVYPSVVSFMAIVITMVMILKVIPVFKDMFSGFGAALPAPTQFLINLSDAMRGSFVQVAVVIGLAVFAGKWYVNTEKGRLQADGLKLKLPVFGVLFKKVAVSKFTRTLSTLVRSGVPILQALEIVAKTSGNTVIEKSINEVKESVREGESIAVQMQKSGIFPGMVTRMIAVGEKSGQLETMLTKIADFYDEQVDASVDALTSLIEPLVIAFLGIVIGGIVICMFLPIFKMSTLIQA